MAKYMLVSFKTCPWVQRSAIVLREKNTEFELRHIESDNRPEWFLAISPHKKVPVLRIDDTVSLFEFAGGATGIVHADFLRPAKAPTHGDDRLRVVGGTGTIEVRDVG